MRVKVVSILGGMPYPLQNKLLSSLVDILVATPGRLIDHIERGRIDFSRLEMLVLDEADRMLDMGFIDDVERIAAATPATRQTLLFSATLEGVIGNLASRLLKSPKRISVSAAQARHENIEQRLMYRGRHGAQESPARPPAARCRHEPGIGIHRHQARCRFPGGSACPRRSLCRGPARRHEPARTQPHPAQPAQRQRAHAGRHRRRRSRH